MCHLEEAVERKAFVTSDDLMNRKSKYLNLESRSSFLTMRVERHLLGAYKRLCQDKTFEKANEIALNISQGLLPHLISTISPFISPSLLLGMSTCDTPPQ